MSEQRKDAAQAPAEEAGQYISAAAPPPAEPTAEPKPAHAVLQEAVKAAEREAAAKGEDRTTAEKPAPEPSVPPVVDGPRPAASAGAYRPLAQAAALVVALGLGGASGWSASVLSSVARSRMEPPPASETANGAPVLDRSGAAFRIRLSETENVRLATELRAMRSTVDGLKDALERARQDQAGRIAQVGDRLERAGRTEQELAQKLASLSERLERGDRDGSAKVAERLERIERQVGAAASTAAPVKMTSAAPEVPAQTGSIAPRQSVPDAKPGLAPLEGWVLRDVDGGVALIENRNRRLVEIGPGDIVPGTGSRVESIEKRGKGWIVITAKGTIGMQP